MMRIRDRVVRVGSLLVLVAGSAAIVGAAGADWSGPPAPRVASGVASPSASTSSAGNRATMLAARSAPHAPHAPHAPRVEARTAHRPVRLWLPRVLPARFLPAGSHLPNPEAPPSNPYAARQPTQLGRMVIPAIALDQPIFEGVDQAAFAHGVGHWPGTAGPGGWGNAVFGGHRVTQTHPFLNTDTLRAGDEIDLVMRDGWTYVYRVTGVFVVPQTAMWIADQKAGRTITLFTCHPKGSAAERLVTTGVLVRIAAAA
jgi:LPXTG-site transpeptidase (sortase) family protein